MVSDCLFPNRRITLPPDIPDAVIQAKGLDRQRRHATEFFEYGRNKDGYWKSEHLVAHILDIVIPMIEILYPPEQYSALFFFDNATSHSCFAPDALQAKGMNLSPRGDQASMRNTAFIDPISGTRKEQSMVFPSAHEKFPNQPKGLREVLKEHGLWRNGLRLDCKDKKCGTCKEIDKKRATIVKVQSCQKPKTECSSHRRCLPCLEALSAAPLVRKCAQCKILKSHIPGNACCARHLLDMQPDFST